MRKTKALKESKASLASCPPRCRRIFKRLSAYLDREIPPEKCAEIRQHIRGCSNCGAFFNTFRKTVELCIKSKPPALNRQNRKMILNRILKKAAGS